MFLMKLLHPSNPISNGITEPKVSKGNTRLPTIREKEGVLATSALLPSARSSLTPLAVDPSVRQVEKVSVFRDKSPAILFRFSRLNAPLLTPAWFLNNAS